LGEKVRNIGRFRASCTAQLNQSPNKSASPLHFDIFLLFFAIISQATSMNEGNSYMQSIIFKRVAKCKRAVNTLFSCGLLLCGLPVFAQNNAPAFVAGGAQAITVCQNASATSIDANMSIDDIDAFQTETWTVVMAPAFGSLGGFPFSTTSTGSALTPAGLSYMPGTGFSGLDSFIIQVSDGIAQTTTIVYANVTPLATLTTPFSDSICNGEAFIYIPTSNEPSATFTWHRPFIGGISNPVASGTDTIDEVLDNTSYYYIPVTYNFVVTANGCSNAQDVVVTVKPTPRLSSIAFDTVCSGSVYHYVPVTPTTGTTYTWLRSSVSGISPDVSTGTGNISETLTNSNGAATNVVYSFLLTANGCTAIRDVNVLVSRSYPVIATITTKPAPSVCAGSLYLNVGVSTPPPSGVAYTWSAANADIVGIGASSQYVLVNFPHAGSASVTFTYAIAGTRCVVSNTVPVTVGSTTSTRSNVIFNNQQFVYLDNTATGFQWGYDNAATLDSTVVPGATFQSYPIISPDFTHFHYWVLATKSGCTHKVYYNKPLAVTNINSGKDASMNIYPNPAGSLVTIELNIPQGGMTEVAITNMLGQTVKTQTIQGLTAQFEVSDLPAGCYMVNSVQNGVKLTAGRFIKN
jgi:hypothetical protein